MLTPHLQKQQRNRMFRITDNRGIRLKIILHLQINNPKTTQNFWFEILTCCVFRGAVELQVYASSQNTCSEITLLGVESF